MGNKSKSGQDVLKMLSEIKSLRAGVSPEATFGFRYYLSWQDHATFPEETTEVAPGLFTTLFDKTARTAERLMQTDAEVILPEQVHINMNESIEVYSGELIELISGRVLSPGDSMFFPAGTPHAFRCSKGPSVSSFVFTHLPHLDYLVDS